ncbi:MAG: TRAP transporter large permease subunit [Pseudomonadota bacterium]
MEPVAFVLFVVVCLLLLLGFPVALTLAGTAVLFALGGVFFGEINIALLKISFLRLEGILSNRILLAIPLFIFMGFMLERAKIAEKLLTSMSECFRGVNGGLAMAVTLVGMLLAASTGIVGATVVTMGLLSLPVMLKKGYDPRLATGIICASGTLGQIIPPSIVLIILGDVISSAYRDSQVAGDPVSVGDLFAGALIPGLLLVLCYLLYLWLVGIFRPQWAPASRSNETSENTQLAFVSLLKSLFLPLILICIVLGSILLGVATPTEAAAIGAAGSILLASLQGEFSISRLKEVMLSTTKSTSMVYLILIGASIFAAVFRMFDGENLVQGIFEQMPGGVFGAVILVMVMIFLLGFILDFVEITYVVVPLVAPVLIKMGVDPLWLGIMIAINLQTSFLTPPFGFALFYLRGVAPKTITTNQLYVGVMPFIAIQLLVLIMLAIWPQLVTWLPGKLF